MSEYLYGLSVQGIQSYIFETNNADEIIGASILIEKICKGFFNDFLKANNIKVEDNKRLIQAAGNVKVVLNEKDCAVVFKYLPKFIYSKVPDITISQSSVKLKDSLYQKDIELLESKLKAKRNIIPATTDFGYMVCERDRKTGGVVSLIKDKKNNKRDFKSYCKQEESGTTELLHKALGDSLLKKIKPKISKGRKDFSYLLKRGSEKSFIAVIHADGNDIGLVISSLIKQLEKDRKSDSIIEGFKQFSESLELATKEALQQTCIDFESDIITDNRLHISPILIGGDDVTLLLSADVAVAFTKKFMQHFEKKTATHFKFLNEYKVKGYENGLTICAGISFIKSNYPFYYGADLAELLCGQAKAVSKDKMQKDELQLPPSSLSFYKVQSSFVEPLEKMKKRSLHDVNERPIFDNGPYFLHEKDVFAHYKTIDYLTEKVDWLKGKRSSNNQSKGSSKLRQLISTLKDRPEEVPTFIDRIIEVDVDGLDEAMDLKSIKANVSKGGKTSLFDILLLHSMQ